MISDAMEKVTLEEGATEAKKAKGQESSGKASEKKIQKPKFKDFTLDAGQLFTVISDDDTKKALSVPSSVKTGVKEDFEVVAPESPFVDAAVKESQKSRTENFAPTYKTSADARVDFFFHVLEQTENSETRELLERSWKQSPVDTLKLIAVLRDIRGGKGIRSQYQMCLYWLYQNHPRTLYENLEELLKFGYWKDCLHLLIIILFDGYIHPYMSRDDKGGNRGHSVRRLGRKRKASGRACDLYDFEETGLYNSKIASHFGKDLNKLTKEEKTELRLQFAREKFEKNLKYRLFHVRIAQCFAKQLTEDLAAAQKKEKGDMTVSLAGKWAPSIEAHFDRYTLIASTIAVEILKIAGETDFEWRTKPLPIAVYLARKHYHKSYCVPLRKFHEVPEVAMSAGEWNKVNYKRVPSKCMQRNSKSFTKHDADRFAAFLERPESHVAGAALKPVEILARAMAVDEDTPETERIVIEKQWESLVEDIKKKGSSLLKNAICVCDVSGSMFGQPMEAAMGLTLIAMNMCEAPWNSICITFHESPSFHNLDSTLSLVNKVESLRQMPWGGNTDIHKVFHLILSLGQEKKLKQEQMPAVLLIFTDMEFDEAFMGSSVTNFDAAKALFAKEGYTLPTIVFWNLRAKGSGKMSTPVQMNEAGAILLSGFSAQQLAYVMDQKDISNCSPLQFMLDVINRERYSKLAVHD